MGTSSSPTVLKLLSYSLEILFYVSVIRMQSFVNYVCVLSMSGLKLMPNLQFYLADLGCRQRNLLP